MTVDVLRVTLALGYHVKLFTGQGSYINHCIISHRGNICYSVVTILESIVTVPANKTANVWQIDRLFSHTRESHIQRGRHRSKSVREFVLCIVFPDFSANVKTVQRHNKPGGWE